MYYDARESGTMGYMKNGVDMGVMQTNLNNYNGYGADLSEVIFNKENQFKTLKKDC